MVVLLVILIGCAAILGIQALVRGWRAASAREQAENVSRGAGSLDTGDECLPNALAISTEKDSFRKALHAQYLKESPYRSGER